MKLSKNERRKLTTKGLLSTIVIVVVLGVTAISFSNGGRVDQIENSGIHQFFYGFGKHINRVLDFGQGFVSDIIYFRHNSRKLKEVEAQNDKLKKEIIDLKGDGEKMESLDRLKKSLNYVSSDSRNELVSASIIGKNDGDWYKSFIIDAGSDAGVSKNSIVINDKGVVGIVYSVSNRYSKSISLVDSRASVSFKVPGESDKNGVITTSSMVGNADFTDVNKLLRGYMFDSKSKIKTGDLIVTSGVGLYPENIPIGKITSVNYDKNKSMKIIKVRPNVDFKKLNDVSIIPPRRTE